MLIITTENSLDIEIRDYEVPKDTRGYLYIVTDVSVPGYVKIGRTNNMHKRMLGYNSDRPYPCVKVLAVSRMFKNAARVETAILDHMKSRISTINNKLEWFQHSQVEELIELVAYYENKEDDYE